MTPPVEPTAALVEARDLVTPKVLAAAWDAWRVRHKGKLGPGPAFVEAVTAGVAVALSETRSDAATQRDQVAVLEAERAKHMRWLGLSDDMPADRRAQVELAHEWTAQALDQQRGRIVRHFSNGADDAER